MERAQKPLILLVDDEEPIRQLLKRALVSAGSDIAAVSDVSSAMAELSAREFDLLLVDKNLPDGSGLDIIRSARERGHRSEAIIVTGYTDADSAIQAVALGVFRYVRKPFDMDALLLDVDNAVETGRLRRDLARRTEELEIANEEISETLGHMYLAERRTRQAERLANIGYLAAGVAHEINNPLSLLSMTVPSAAKQVRELLAGLDGGMDKTTLLKGLHRLKHWLEPSQEALEFLMRLSSDLRSLGRTENQDLRPVKLVEVVGSASRLVRHQLKHKATLAVDVDEAITVNGQSSRLVQVFINLLTNATKAIDGNHPAANKVSIAAHEETDRVIIRVSDTGRGIAPELQQRIFEPFFSVPAADGEQGSGIGLTLVKEIVGVHGGDVGVESEEGRGTTFTISLPRQAAQRTSISVVPPSQSVVTSSRRRVLVVANAEADRDTYENTFGAMHDLLLAHDASTARELLATHHATLDALVYEIPPGSAAIDATLRDMAARWPGIVRRTILIADPGAAFDQAVGEGYHVLARPVRLSQLLAAIHQLASQPPPA